LIYFTLNKTKYYKENFLKNSKNTKRLSSQLFLWHSFIFFNYLFVTISFARQEVFSLKIVTKEHVSYGPSNFNKIIINRSNWRMFLL